MAQSTNQRSQHEASPRPADPAWAGPFGDERAYRIGDPLHVYRGGLGVVFDAVICSDRHGPDLVGTRVGLKKLTGLDEFGWCRLEERSGQLAEVNHPKLSRHLGVFTGPPPFYEGSEPDHDDPQRYIVHVWAEGRPLADAVDTEPATVLGWLRQVAEGLDRLHEHPAGPFAHRDLHPRNVIVSEDGDATVIDFETVFVGHKWTRTRGLRGSRFAPPPNPSMSPQAADRRALAKIVLHALAGDGEGALEDDEVVDGAANRLRTFGITPEPALALLSDALVGRGPTTCKELIAGVERAAGAGRRRAGIRWLLVWRARRRLRRGRPTPAGSPARTKRLGAAVVLVVALALLLGVAASALVSRGTPDRPTPTTSLAPPTPSTPPVATTTPTPAVSLAPAGPAITAPTPTARQPTTVTTATPPPTTLPQPAATAAPTTPNQWQAPTDLGDRSTCGDYRDLRAAGGIFSFQACVVVYRDLQGTYWYQGLLAVSYTPTVATAADRLAGKVWSVAGDVTNAGHSCPSVQWKQGRQWCFGPTLAYTGSGSLSAVAEVVEPRGTRMTVVSPSFFV